jgi:hypothetical protein
MIKSPLWLARGSPLCISTSDGDAQVHHRDARTLISSRHKKYSQIHNGNCKIQGVKNDHRNDRSRRVQSGHADQGDRCWRVVLNEKLLEVLGDDITQDEAFAHANDVLKNAVGGIAEIINVPAT